MVTHRHTDESHYYRTPYTTHPMLRNENSRLTARAA